MPNRFDWTDLSTFDLSETRQFYKKCFGWQYQDIGDEYFVGHVSGQSAAGMYTMPQKFQDINMPSFWMSYILVSDIDGVVQRAESKGAIIEVRPETGPSGGIIALIRDPSGAGFTCYQGEDLEGRDQQGALGRLAWNELHVSDVSLVQEFYTHVFDWDIRQGNTPDRYLMFAKGENTPLAGITVTPNEIKGDKQYWGVYFNVSNLAQTQAVIELAGGSVEGEQPLGDVPALLAYDPQGAAFYVMESKRPSSAAQSSGDTTGIKWRAWLGLALVGTALALNLNWIWGIFFLTWVIPDIKRAETYFLERVTRRHNPLLYWLIITTWLGLSGLMFFM